MVVKNPLLFVSKKTGKYLSGQTLKFFQTLPRQLPKEFEEEKLEEEAIQTRDGVTAVIIV